MFLKKMDFILKKVIFKGKIVITIHKKSVFVNIMFLIDSTYYSERKKRDRFVHKSFVLLKWYITIRTSQKNICLIYFIYEPNLVNQNIKHKMERKSLKNRQKITFSKNNIFNGTGPFLWNLGRISDFNCLLVYCPDTIVY